MSRIKRWITADNAVTLAGNLMSAVLAAAVVFILARSLDKTAFGLWMLYLASFTLLEMLRTGLIRTALVRFASSADHVNLKQIIGTSWLIALLISAFFSSLIAGCSLVFPQTIDRLSLSPFFKWYPLMVWASLPWNMAIWILHARQKFIGMVTMKLLAVATFFSMIIFLLKPGLTLDIIITCHISAHLLASIAAIAGGWAKTSYIRHFSHGWMKTLIGFSRFSFGTLIGTNLLKSSDTYLIGALMNPAAVALYSLPLKLLEIAEMPLRSFAMTAFPRISHFSDKKDYASLNTVFNKNTGLFILLFMPLSLLCIAFPGQILHLAGGASFCDGADILRIFGIFILLLPFDRFIGITLDSLNKPHINLLKVSIMLVVNIIGDFIAIYLTGSLTAVTLVTVLNTLIGIAIGIYFLRKEISFRLRNIIQDGWLWLKWILWQKAVANR